jgi:ubiquinone/menaquinone biosynthesis C-methylase UbiE/uncharacterized protein YbaR (Trm112 family)
MQRRLLELLVCPRCLPAEKPLRAAACELRDDDVYTAMLTCPSCGAGYPVQEGVAVLLVAPPERDVYAAKRLAAYLWGHYADLAADPDAHQAFPAWAGLLAGSAGPALDTGCAVGRLSFELARHAELVIGLDLSAGFVRAARTLAREGRLAYALVVEGELSEERLARLPADLPRERVEFVQADAQALPFPASLFATATSLNLLDRVPVPRRHLAELNRVTKTAGATLLVADPWSWAESPAPSTAWLGGCLEGANAGASPTNLQRWLETACRPPWRVAGAGRIAWTLRNHRNHFELIRSDYLLSRR